jgi:hypothetical protein
VTSNTARFSGKLIWAMALLAALAATCVIAQQTTKDRNSGGSATGASGAASSPKPQATKRAAPITKVEQFPLDKVVVKVGTEQATAADVEYTEQFMAHEIQEEVLEEGRMPVGEEYVKMVALTQEAARQHLDADPNFHRRMAVARMQWLGDAELKRLQDQVKVTSDDVKQYYDSHLADYTELQVRDVSVRKKLANAEGSPGLADEEAKAKADAIRQAIQSGTDFDKVSAQFAVPDVVYFGPQPRAVHHRQFPAEVEQKLFSLKDGELSDTTSNPQVVSFMQIVKHSQVDLKDVKGDIEIQLRARKLEDSIKALEHRASVWMDPEYFAPLQRYGEPKRRAGEPDADDPDRRK